MRLEDLDTLASDHGPPDAPDQLFALAGEHHPGDHLDPAGARAVEHVNLRLHDATTPSSTRTPGNVASWRPETGGKGSGRARGGQASRRVRAIAVVPSRESSVARFLLHHSAQSETRAVLDGHGNVARRQRSMRGLLLAFQRLSRIRSLSRRIGEPMNASPTLRVLLSIMCPTR